MRLQEFTRAFDAAARFTTEDIDRVRRVVGPDASDEDARKEFLRIRREKQARIVAARKEWMSNHPELASDDAKRLGEVRRKEFAGA